MLFVEALGRPVAFFHNFPRAHAEGDGAPGGATIVRFVPRSLSRDAGASWRAIAASSLLRRAALCRDRPLLPPWLRVLGEAHGGRSAPESQAPGGRLIVAAGRSSRRRPGAGERPLPAAGAASDPSRMTPHESALWRTGHC